MTTALLVLFAALAQPYALTASGTVATINDPAGWCAARPAGPRVGSLVHVEGFVPYDLAGDGDFYQGDGIVTINGIDYAAWLGYYPAMHRIAMSGTEVTAGGWWMEPGFTSTLWIAWDGIPDPPDLTGQGYADCIMMIDSEVIARRLPGDSNDDGKFTTADLVLVFTAGEYEDGVPRNSTWATGDWNADREFRSNDLVAVMQTGAYEKPAAAMVPEPGAVVLLMAGCVLATLRQRQSTALSPQMTDLLVALHRC